MPETAEILLKAADVIDEIGWYQGDLYDPRGTGMCTMAAMYVGAGLNLHRVMTCKDTSQAGADVDAAIGRFQQWLGVESVVEWNDARERTVEQVTSALRQCAAETAERDGIQFPKQLSLAGAP